MVGWISSVYAWPGIFYVFVPAPQSLSTMQKASLDTAVTVYWQGLVAALPQIQDKPQVALYKANLNIRTNS